MAAIQQGHLFEDGDGMLFGGTDLFGNDVTCIAGELELQVQAFEDDRDLAVGDSSAGKSFAITKDSGGSSLSALVATDFADADFMDHVSLDDLAAADHYGHTICGRQSTADSGLLPAAASGRASVSWGAAGGPTVSAPKAAAADTVPSRAPFCADEQRQAQESSDCDISHTVADGESSGVGHGKDVALGGSSQSETSEDNTAGMAACRDEEHISMPSFGLSLARLTQVNAQQQQQQQRGAAPLQQTQFTGASVQQQRGPSGAMTRAYSVDSFAVNNNAAAASSEQAAAAQADGARRAQVMRSFSYVAPETLPMEFSLGCDDNGLVGFGARGRCASLNESQLRRQWLQEGELLAPRLPPSVSELELLELPEDSVPVRPSRCSLLDMQQQAPAEDDGSAGGDPVGSDSLAHFKAGSGSSVAGGLGQGTVTVTVKRKIITSPSPLLQQPRSARSRQAAAATATESAKVQSPKRAKVGSGAHGLGGWQEGGGAAPPTAGALADWQQQPRGGASGGMKTSRSMPANMNNFLEGVEVTVQPLGLSGAPDTVISPNCSAVSASMAHQPFGRPPPFMDAAAGAVGAAPRTNGMAAAVPQVIVPPPAKAGKGRGAAAAGHALPAPIIMPGMGMACAFPPGGVPVGPDGKRFGPVPSVPKPRKRASPNGNPPKAPAPNPNGHCCTQCGTQTTPVWRAGPHGPKTLCNACGVRYMKVAKGNVAPTPRSRQQH